MLPSSVYLMQLLAITIVTKAERPCDRSNLPEVMRLCHSSYGSFCNCSDRVISCDISPLIHSGKHTKKECIEFQRGWERAKRDVERMCFCGGSKDMEYLFAPNLTELLPNLQRIDFYNMPGVIRFNHTFGTEFAGDIYMSGVRVNTIHAHEFKKGNKMNIKDVSDIQCCSQIPTYTGVAHPILSLEDSSLGLIEYEGITDDNHNQWNSVFIENVEFRGIEKEGIIFRQPYLNISIVNCTFLDANDYSIVILDAASIFFAKNVFTSACSFAPMIFNSATPNSVLLLTENYFNNRIEFFLQSSYTLIWLNRFDMWHNRTFSHLKILKGSKISIAWNAVNITEYMRSMLLPSEATTDQLQIEFFSNVLGFCSCNSPSTEWQFQNSSHSICELQDQKNTCRINQHHFMTKHCDKPPHLHPSCKSLDNEHSLTVDFASTLYVNAKTAMAGATKRFLQNLISEVYLTMPFSLPSVDQELPNDSAVIVRISHLNKIVSLISSFAAQVTLGTTIYLITVATVFANAS